jgi:hypothetical protein
MLLFILVFLPSSYANKKAVAAVPDLDGCGAAFGARMRLSRPITLAGRLIPSTRIRGVV